MPNNNPKNWALSMFRRHRKVDSKRLFIVVIIQMNRVTLAMFIVAVVMVMHGCQPALDTNRNNAVATASPAKETYDAAAIEAEILKLEREWADSNKTHNSEAVKRIVADSAVI